MDNETEKCIINRLRSAGCVFTGVETHLLISEARNPEDLKKMVEMRGDGLPLEYAVGYAEFCGLRIEVDRGVFVPRKRTEFLFARQKPCHVLVISSLTYVAGQVLWV